MRQNPLVSVVVINYNGRDLLQTCLDSVASQTYAQIETILIDNGSADSSVEFVKERYPAVKIIANSMNVGYAPAANQAIDNSSGEFIVILNNDTRADPGWIDSLVCVALGDEKIGICASKQLNFFEPKLLDSAGICFFRGGYARDRGRGEPDSGQYDDLGEVFGAAGASAFYRRSMLVDIGHFDEDYFAYCEEFDLSFRAQLRGWKCVFVPEAVIYHMSGRTRAQKDQGFLVYYVERNRICTIVKDYPLSLFLMYLPFLIKYEIDALIRFFKRFEIELLSARLGALKLLPSMLKKRSAIQKIRNVSIDSLVTHIDKEKNG